MRIQFRQLVSKFAIAVIGGAVGGVFSWYLGLSHLSVWAAAISTGFGVGIGMWIGDMLCNNR